MVSAALSRPLSSARTGGPDFAIYLPQTGMTFGTIEEKVRIAEGLGFHSVWLMDHLATPATPEADTFEALTLTAALAARTTKIRLGQLCLNVHFRNPAVLAKEAATIDVISGGRLELGLGWGATAAELSTYGINRDDKLERVRKLVETIEILRLMFTGEPFSYRGTHHQLDGAVGRPTPVQTRVPIHVGGADRRLTIPLARKYADWWNCPSYAADGLPQLVAGLGGRTKVSVQHVVGLAPGRSQREVTRHEAENRFGSWGGLITGIASEVATHLIEEAQLGVDLFVLQFSDFGTARTLKLFAREVMPVVRQAAERRA